MSRPPDEQAPAGRELLETYDAVAGAVAAAAAAAHHRLRIYAPSLDPRLFANAALTEAVASLAAASNRNRARVLVQDSASVLHSLPRWLALARRLPTFVEVRRLAEDQEAAPEMFVLVDRAGYVHQPRIELLRVLADPADGRTTSRLVRRFDALWDRSEPIAEISTLGL